jgi:two-component system, sensor histidine kinase PdtaS
MCCLALVIQSQENWEKVRNLEKEVRYTNHVELLHAADDWEFIKKEEEVYKAWLKGLYAWYNSDHTQAYVYLSQAYQQSSNKTSKILSTEIAMDLARVFSIVEQTGKSLTLLLKIEDDILDVGNHHQKARYYIQLAELYRRMAEFEKAMSSLNASKAYIATDEMKAYYLNRKAAVLTETLQHDEARKCSHQALALAKKTNNPDYVAISYNELAYLHRHTEKQDSVYYYYSKADSVWGKAGQVRYAADAKLKLSIWHAVDKDFKNLSKSKSIAYEIIAMLKNKGWDFLDHSVYEHMANLHFEENNIDSAKYYKTLSFDAFIKYSEKRNEVLSAIVEGEYTQKKNESLIREQRMIIDQETQLNAQIQQENRLFIIIIVISSITIVLLTILARMSFAKRKKAIATAEVEFKIRSELEHNLEEKNLLLAEVNHRVKNNLQTMSSLLDLQRLSEKSEKVKISLLEAQRRIDAMGIVHEMLYLNEYMNRINIRDYITNLVQSEQAIYEGSNLKINFHLELESFMLDINQCINIGMITSEFISNSFKHAFEKTQNPTVCIRLKHDGKTIELTIEDNGKGIGKDQLNENEIDSLGLKLIAIFCKKLDAQQHITGSDFGTTLKISFSKQTA